MKFFIGSFLTLSLLISNISFANVISNPHFYMLVAPNGKQSFILGTIHGGVEISELPGQILEKLNQSSIFINEWNFSDEEVDAVLSGHVIDEQLKKFIHKGDDLSPEIKQQLISEWGVDSRLAEVAKSNDCFILSFGGPISSGYMDFHFLEMAKKQNKEILSLDTQDEFDSLKKKYPQSPCDIRNVLIQATPSQFKSYQLNMIEEYRSGAIPARDDDPVVIARNQFWVPKLSDKLNLGNVFIDVGVGHLYGPQGLLQLLQQIGYKVTRIY